MKNGIFCLEGDWEHDLRRTRSLLPVLNLVQSQSDVSFIHRTASTRDEFRRVIHQWLKSQYSSYPILYLGFHGEPGALLIGDEQIPLEDLVEFREKGRNRVIHFSACATLDIPAQRLKNFLRRTKFTAVCGFTKEVDWLYSTALEILILDQLSSRKITGRNMDACLSQLNREARTLVRRMGFTLLKR